MYHAILVDDEPFVLEGLKDAIDWEGYQFEISATFTNPLEALQYIQSHSVHLLITDVSMPELNGIDLIMQAKEAAPLLSILVLSAHENFDYVKTALRSGAENYLLKPVDQDELAASISQIVNHMQEREQVANEYSVNTLTFTGNLTESWVKNDLALSDLKVKASFIGLDINTDNFTVVIFTSTDNDIKRMSSCFDILLNAMSDRFTNYFYFETPLRLVCVLSTKPYDKDAILHLAESLDRYKLPIFISVGETVKHFSEVHNSYYGASSLLFLKHTYKKCYSHPDILMPSSVTDKIWQPFDKVDAASYIESISSIYDKNDAALFNEKLSIAILVWCFQQIKREIDDVFEKFPEMIEVLHNFPKSHIQFKSYTIDVVRQCFKLVDKVRQSMFPCVDAVIDAINAFDDKDICLKSLAHKLKVSPSYLGKTFKQQTGLYFSDYLAQARLNYASELILNTELKIKDIVDKVGFSSQTYFNRIFKQYYDVSPVTYRRIKHQ